MLDVPTIVAVRRDRQAQVNGVAEACSSVCQQLFMLYAEQLRVLREDRDGYGYLNDDSTVCGFVDA